MKNCMTYIFVHDQEIIISYENNLKFSKFFGKDYCYVFVGDRDYTKIENMTNVIIAKKQTNNIEEYKKLVTFTGWYVLVKNNLLKSNYKYSLLIEYDVILSDKFNTIVDNTIKQSKNKDVFSFINIPKDFLFYEYLKDVFDIKELKIKRDEYILNGGKSDWMGSSNSLWKTELIKEFVEWFDNYKYKYVNDDIGHSVERALTVFCIEKNIHYKFIGNALQHYFLDSHKTQAIHNNGIQKNYQEYIKELSLK